MKRWMRIAAFSLVGLLIAPLLLAVTAGPNYAGAIGTTQWTNSTNATGAPDNLCATETSATQIINLISFGFTIPPAAIVQGITVELKFADSSTGGGRARLLKNGVPDGTDKGFFRPSGATNCGTSAFLTLGGSTDLWGTTWTAADINASNFGVQVEKDGIFGTIYLDAVRITIEYQDVMQVAIESGGTLTTTVAQSDVELGRVEFTGQTTLKATATRNWRVRATVVSNSFPGGADDPTPSAVRIKDYLGSFQPGGTPGVIVHTGTPTPAAGETFTVDIRILLNMFGDGKTTPPPYLFNVNYTIEDNP